MSGAGLPTKIIIAEDEADTFPGLILGAASIFTTIWWVVLMIAQVTNHTTDDRLRNRADELVYPVAWFWERIVETTDIYVYMSIGMMWGFLSQFLVSFIEMVTWVLYLVGFNTPFMIWSSIAGTYGSLVLYAMPCVFLALQVGITQKGKVSASPGSYVIFLFVVYFSLWMINTVLHLVFVPRMVAHVMSLDNKCAREMQNCPLKRGTMSDAEYCAACIAIANAVKVDKPKEEEGLGADEDEDEDATDADAVTEEAATI